MALIDEEENGLSEFDAVESMERKEAPAAAPERPKVPSKYEGKSLEDIMNMHQEAEKLIGRQAQEVGEVRKLADELLKQQLYKKEEPATTESEIDFFEDPKTAVRNAVDRHPDVVAAKQAAQEFKQMQTQTAIQKKHPDFTEVVQDSEFIEWVKSSPYRLNMYAQADAQFDFGAADELISTFKQIRSVKTTQARSDGAEVLKQNMKAAMVDTSGTGESSRKVYRRADLIRLRMTDPSRYEALEPEIRQAYAEGRVK
jgi:vacuolar-type H+-ATPase subunit I/STV1